MRVLLFRMKQLSTRRKSNRGSLSLLEAKSSSTSQAQYGQLVPVGPIMDRTPPNFRVLLKAPESASSVVSAKVLCNICAQHGIPEEDVRLSTNDEFAHMPPPGYTACH